MGTKRRLQGLDRPVSLALPLGNCPLCGRPLVAGKSVDEHHLLPKSQGGREKFLMHRICHRKIHATFTEKDLAKHFNTWAALRAHEGIAAFIAWVQKKSPEFYDNSRKSSSRR
jgi:5-methylcytosine-specific restriction endonuclease McrA